MPSPSYVRIVRDDTYGVVDRPDHFVYTIHDPSGRPVYVGCTNDPVRRLEEHRRSAWGADAHKMTYERHATKREALSAESALIREIAPKYNLARPNPSSSGVSAVSDLPCACPEQCCNGGCGDMSAVGRRVSERCKKRMQRS